MAPNTIGSVGRVSAALAIMLALMAGTVVAQSIQGLATYAPRRILTDRRYVVRERIVADDKLLFTSDTAIPVITHGSPTNVSIMLRRGGGQIPPASAAGDRSLEGAQWKATELAGKPTPTQDTKREAHLVFQAGGRLSGSDGCNRITGTYDLKGTAVTFGEMAGTLMACIDSAAEVERAFRNALKSARRLTIAGDRLDLFDATGNRVGSFIASAQASVPTNTPAFAGRSWQLVKFQGSDGTTLTPDDRATYTIEFASGGELTARVDCNRGRGMWTSSGPNQVQFGPLALTRATCPVGSLHDQIAKQWNYIRSYLMKDGHLFLSLMADAGIYEFEPITESKPSLSKPQAQGGAGQPRVLEVSSVAPEKNAELSSLIAEIRSEADAFVILSGGASRMSQDHQRQLLAMFEALSLVAKGGRRIAVGDGGTQAGIMEAAGHARRKSGNAFPLIGVAPLREIPPRGKTPLDPNHSHVVGVDNPSASTQDSWGSETDTMYWLFDKLAEGRPSVAIVANGGGITLAEVESNVRAGRRIILIEGSGRAADALVSLLKKTQVSDAEIVNLRERAEKVGLTRRPELFQIVPLQAGASSLGDAIAAAIGGR